MAKYDFTIYFKERKKEITIIITQIIINDNLVKVADYSTGAVLSWSKEDIEIKNLKEVKE